MIDVSRFSPVVSCPRYVEILIACIRAAGAGACQRESTVAHLVAFRSGLWRQTPGDEEESSALQFRRVPTEHLGLTNHHSLPACLCVCSGSQCVLPGRVVWRTSVLPRARFSSYFQAPKMFCWYGNVPTPTQTCVLV